MPTSSETMSMSDRDFADQLIDEFVTQFHDNSAVDMTSWHLILPIAADAGIVVHENGDVYFLDVHNESGTSTHLYVDSALEEFERLMKEQVDNASSGQIAHYAAWAHALMETS